jgi:hypothetical protein
MTSKVMLMVLVNQAQGYRVCLECHDVLEQGDEVAWLAVHLGRNGRCTAPTHWWSRKRGPRREVVTTR